MLTLKLLGTPTILLNNESLALKTNKSQALLFYLAVNPGIHARDTLADLLWSEMTTRQARKNLRDVLVQLRALLGDYLQADPYRLGFNQQLPYQIDVNDFVEQIAAGRATNDFPLLEQALALYQTDFLTGFHVHNAPLFDQWSMQKREELYTLALLNMEWLAEQYLQRGAHEAGLRLTQRLLTIEPWEEKIHFLQMRLLVQAGKRVAAIRQFELCREILGAELELTPSTATLDFYEQIKDGLFLQTDKTLDGPGQTSHQRPPVTMEKGQEADSTVAAVASPLPHNLPRRLTDLVGRTREIDKIIEWLYIDENPLITLLGEGGIGKSHLAWAVADRLIGDERPVTKQRFKDGVWFVSLAEIDADEIPDAVLCERVAARTGETLKLNFGGSGKLSSQLTAYLSDKALLLILDSFEHLKQCTAFLLNLLQAAHQLQILITSRRAIGLQAEQILLIDGLALPETIPTSAPWQSLLRYDAIALFYARACRIRKDFTLNDDNRAAIVQICDFVAGSPLGIILATTLLDIHSCTQVAALLNEDYSVLRSEEMDLPLRQRTIQNVLDAAWQALESDQADLIACCSLLQGSFSAEAASAIAAVSAPPLYALVWPAWLRYDEKQQSYTMHARLRQYAAERLAQWPAQAFAARQRHALYHIQLLARSEMQLLYDPAVVDRLRGVGNNIQTAWAWCVEEQRLDLLQEGAQALANFYQVIGSFAEAIQAIEKATAMIRQRGDVEENEATQHALVHLLCCSLIFYQSDSPKLQAVAGEALAWSRRLDDKISQAIALNGLSWAALWHNFQESLELAQQAHVLLVTRQQPRPRTYALRNIALAYGVAGDFDSSIAYFSQALEQLQQAPNADLAARIHLDVALFQQRQKNFTRARHHLSEALRLAHIFHNQRAIGLAYLHLGDL